MVIIEQDEIVQFIENIWDSLLNIPVSLSNKTFQPEGKNNTLASCIQITGAWQGSVTLYCSIDLAKKLGAAMISIPPEDLSPEGIQDVMGEITNMLAGNIKSLLPQPSSISLPSVAVTDFDLRIPKSELVNTLTFESADSLFMLCLLQESGSE